MTVMVVLMAGVALATPKWVNAVPSCDENGNVVIPAMPAEATLVNVFIYDDVRGTLPKTLGPVSTFELKPGQGFNFIWSDKKGDRWFQMVTPKSIAKGLVTDYSSPKGCKYLYSGK